MQANAKLDVESWARDPSSTISSPTDGPDSGVLCQSETSVRRMKPGFWEILVPRFRRPHSYYGVVVGGFTFFRPGCVL